MSNPPLTVKTLIGQTKYVSIIFRGGRALIFGTFTKTSNNFVSSVVLVTESGDRVFFSEDTVFIPLTDYTISINA